MRMAVASLPRPGFFSSGHGILSQRVKLASAFSPRAVNSDDSTAQERTRISLKELDEQLLSASPPRELPGIEIEDKQKEAPAKGNWLALSDRFLVYLTGGLVLLTIVNNFLFYYFIELPRRESDTTQEKVRSNMLSVDSSKVAPQLQAQTEM